jgi:hypothetical protein
MMYMYTNHRQHFTFFRYPKNGAESLESQVNIKHDFKKKLSLFSRRFLKWAFVFPKGQKSA